MSEYTLSDGLGSKVREEVSPNKIMVDAHPANLTATSTVLGSDMTAVQNGTATPSKTSEDQRADFSRWRSIATSRYTSTPASTSVLTMSDTSGILVGMPVKFVISSTTYYGIVTAVSANTSITIAGASLSSSVTALFIGAPELVVQMDFFIAGKWATSTGDKLASVMKSYAKWQAGDAFLVFFEAVQNTGDTGTQPKLNLKIAGNAVSTNDSNNGIQLSTAGTWVANSAIAISTSNYDITRGDAIEVNCSGAAGNDVASDLTVSAVFVLK